MVFIKCTSAPIFAESLNRTFINFNRVSKLFSDYKKTENKDILRLAIIFIHATLEDTFRNLIYFKLLQPEYSKYLADIPLLETKEGKGKYNLTDLANFRAFTVEELLSKSVLEFVNKQTFNSGYDIGKWLSMFDLNKKPLTDSLKKIDELIKRRHRIVHNTDMDIERMKLSTANETLYDGNADNLEEIDLQYVSEGYTLVYSFLYTCIHKFLPPSFEITMQNA